MLCWDPALVVGLRAARDSGTISANNADLVGGIDSLRTLGRALSALAALAAATLLREERRDPGVVDEVAGASERGCEN